MPVAATVPAQKKGVGVCLDAGELISEFQAQGFQFALHGHGHVPFVGTVGTVARVMDHSIEDGAYKFAGIHTPMFVLGCGSSGAHRNHLPPQFARNVFGLYQPGSSGLQVTFEQYDELGPCEPLWSMTLPTR